MLGNAQRDHADVRNRRIKFIMERVSPEPNTGCWLWMGAGARYGQISKGALFDVGGNAHRWAYRVLVRDIPSNVEVHHKCKNTLCVNPDHMAALYSSHHQEVTASDRRGVARDWLIVRAPRRGGMPNGR